MTETPNITWVHAALAHYDLDIAAVTVLGHHEAMTVQVTERSGVRWLLRLHRPPRASAALVIDPTAI